MKREGTTTFLEHIKKLNIYPRVIMGFYFRPLGYKKQGAFMLGGINDKYYKGPIDYYKVDDTCYWKILITAIKVYFFFYCLDWASNY